MKSLLILILLSFLAYEAIGQPSCVDTPYYTVKGPVIRLQPCDSTISAGFGASIILDDKSLLISAPASPAGGKVFYYRFRNSTNTWELKQIIRPSTPVVLDRFGFSMEYYEGSLLIGAPGADLAYLYSFDGKKFRERKKLTPPPGVEGEFGYQVQIDSATFAIGVPERMISVGSSTPVEGGILLYTYDSTSVRLRTLMRPPGGRREFNARFGKYFQIEMPYMAAFAGKTLCMYTFINRKWELDGKINLRNTYDMDMNGQFLLHSFDRQGGTGIGSKVFESQVVYQKVKTGSPWPELGFKGPAFHDTWHSREFGRSVNLYKNMAAIGRPKSNHFDRNNIGGVYVQRIEGDSLYNVFKYIPKEWPDAVEIGFEVALYDNILATSSEEGDGAVYLINLKDNSLCLPPYKEFTASPAPGSVTISWNSMPDATEYTSAIYEVISGVAPEDFSGPRVSSRITSSSTSATHTGLTPGMYGFKVASVCGTKTGIRNFGNQFFVVLLDDPKAHRSAAFQLAQDVNFVQAEITELAHDFSHAHLVDMHGRILETVRLVSDQLKVQFETNNLQGGIYLVVMQRKNESYESQKFVVP